MDVQVKISNYLPYLTLHILFIPVNLESFAITVSQNSGS